jgi:hypothetical protein
VASVTVDGKEDAGEFFDTRFVVVFSHDISGKQIQY